MDKNSGLPGPLQAAKLIHEALRKAAGEVKGIAGQLETGNSLQGFKLAFDAWAMALVFHLTQEEAHMDPCLATALSTSYGEDGLDSDSISKVILALSRVGRSEQMEMIEEVFRILYHEIGNTSLITRTIQHLYRQVVAMGIAQENHLEAKEVMVLPILCEGMGDYQQLALIKTLLIDDQSDNRRWIVEWVFERSDSDGKAILAELESRFQNI